MAAHLGRLIDEAVPGRRGLEARRALFEAHATLMRQLQTDLAGGIAVPERVASADRITSADHIAATSRITAAGLTTTLGAASAAVTHPLVSRLVPGPSSCLRPTADWDELPNPTVFSHLPAHSHWVTTTARSQR